jgi:hypothetical protein
MPRHELDAQMHKEVKAIAGIHGQDQRHGRSCARDWLENVQPAGQGIPHRHDRTRTTFETGDVRNAVPRSAADARAANQAVVDLLARIAGRLGATPAQIALAWLLAQRPWIVPIPGTRKLARLEENLAAADLELTATDLDEIATASAAITVQGAGYPEAMERLIDR